MKPSSSSITDKTHLHTMQSFTRSSMPYLDVAVLGALELFFTTSLPELKLSFKRPLVVGSGNAAATGHILFQDTDAVFADESTVAATLQRVKAIDGVVIISASGAKHAPTIAKLAKKHTKRVVLITNTQHALAARYCDTVYVFPKQREPYTYNTSTYLGMILGSTHEQPQEMYDFILKNVAALDFSRFKEYDKFFIILPSRYGVGIQRMFQVKFIELFGRRIARDVETVEYMKHAVTVVPSRELFISFGEKNTTWGKNKDRFFVPLPKHADFGAMMAIGYFVIGQIQRAHPSWFFESLPSYTARISRVFNQSITPIVE